MYLLEDGNLLRTHKPPGTDPSNFHGGGQGEKVELVDWGGSVIWEYTYHNDMHRMHHDLAYISNGNILILAWELKTDGEAIDAGRAKSRSRFWNNRRAV